MNRFLCSFVTGVALTLTTLPASRADGPVLVSTNNLLAACTSDNVALQGGTCYANSEVECALDVDPLDAQRLVAFWQQDRWSTGGARGNVAGVSTDGGATWTAVAMPQLTLCGGGIYQRATDPWVSFGPTGDLYQFSLALNEDLPGGGNGANAMLVSKSTDGGFNWSAPQALIADNDPAVFNDKQSITADPTDANYVYAVWDRLTDLSAYDFTGPTWFARTADGGQSWEPARVIVVPGRNQQTLGNQVAVRPDGTVLNFFTSIKASSSKPGRYTLNVATSLDKGLTWKPSKGKKIDKMLPRSLFQFNDVDVFDPESGLALRTAEIIPAVAVDPGNGNLYAVWQDVRFSTGGDLKATGGLIDEIVFSQSTDGGRKWSKPIKVNQTPAIVLRFNRQAFTPSIAVAADGTIAVTYFDFRNNDAGIELWTDYWAAFCTPSPTAPATAPANWGREIRLTAASFDVIRAPDAQGLFLGDYQALKSAGNEFLAVWSQPHSTDPCSVHFRRFAPPVP